jgi:carbonic anhydrase/acetyltransferase-like protein (isoleucine patch superfamily)
VWLYSLTTLTNDPLPPSHFEKPVTVEDGVVVCVGCTILPGSILRQGAFVSAGTKVRGEVPPGAVVDGEYGRVLCHITMLMNLESGLQHPWMNHFADAYPPEAQGRIRALLEAIRSQRAPVYRQRTKAPAQE